jgi:hypothetical protein
MNETDKEIEKTLEKMISDNFISEDYKTEAKAVLTWLLKGREEAEKVSKKAVKNLEKNGFVADGGKLLDVDADNMDMWFLLAVAGAKGEVRQIVEGDDAFSSADAFTIR